MFKNFNWKKYIVRVAIVWVVFICSVGFVSGFTEGETERESRWVSVGKYDDPASTFYVLRNGVTVNASGNAVITVKTEIEDVGIIYAKWEINCKNKMARMIEMGSQFNAMMRVEHEWMIPVKDSVIHRISKPICLIGGI